MLGTSNQSLAGIPLPVNLAMICLPGIDLRTSSEVMVPTTTGVGYLRDGYARVVVPGRFTAGTIGLDLHAQWVWLDLTTLGHGSTAGHSFRIQ
jgi:hypothetical protein